ncbi:ATP-binding protein [Methanoregula formicica]|uniref:Putative transcriptional regulator with HTH domain n=1 Tax=Methanoregula formicica (strain DSM 22288 / NBRC 105244 / SMSP) TaxID=593750 RepID=L0HI81_METFS|nr:ATP-binding protein [Methanoregula formicica]AGB03028.1 putative transcriptional regulator with HTH domain [Methanoregula formicica SMSP]
MSPELPAMRYQESETIELKASLAELDAALIDVCAFLNHRGGSLYFGIRPDGRVVGLTVTDSTLLKISQKIRQRLKPDIIPEIRERVEGGRSIIEVTIGEGTHKPYMVDSIPYIRSGSESVKMPPDVLTRLILERQGYAWDRDICTGATLGDIDPALVKAYLTRARQVRLIDLDPDTPVETALDSLELLKDGTPTNAAILFFGKSPQRFITSAEIRCAKFRGDDVTQPYTNMKVIGGAIVAQIDQTELFIRDNIAKAAWMPQEKFEREESWEYPPDAFREAVINAICHRDYQSAGNVQVSIFANSLEILNPGLLPPTLTIESLKRRHSSKPRNRLIADLLFRIKYIERWGSGTTKMIRVCRDLGAPEPEFHEQDDDFMVTFRRSSVNAILERPELLNDRQKKAMEYLKTHESITTLQYVHVANCHERTARKDLAELVGLNVVVKQGLGKLTRYVIHPGFRHFPIDTGSSH